MVSPPPSLLALDLSAPCFYCQADHSAGCAHLVALMWRRGRDRRGLLRPGLAPGLPAPPILARLAVASIEDLDRSGVDWRHHLVRHEGAEVSVLYATDPARFLLPFLAGPVPTTPIVPVLPVPVPRLVQRSLFAPLLPRASPAR